MMDSGFISWQPQMKGPKRRLSNASNVSSVSNASNTSTGSRRINAKTACSNCKKRKLKCSGEVPCLACVRGGATCSIDENTDQRRKQVMKRKLSTMEEKGVLLDDLVRTLQETDEICAVQMINLVRSHATLEEIRAFLDDIATRDRVKRTPEVLNALARVQSIDEMPRETSGPRLDDKQLSDMVLFQVPAKPWTTVTSDSDFVSHLISLWFTWSHPYLNWIDRDLFIRDMMSGNLDATFCSPFLVNVILADACAYSDFPEAYGRHKGEWSRGAHFYEEAKRLLDEQEGRISIVNVQGLCVLYVVSCMIGKDRTGWVYYGQLAYAAQELSRKHQALPNDADEEAIHENGAIDNTIWGIFNFASGTAFAYQKPALIAIPRCRHKTPDRDVHKDKWYQYPFTSEPVQSHRECLFTALCGMGEIIYELSLGLFKNQHRKLDTEFAQLAQKMFLQLKAWYDELPDCLATIEATPHVLSLHLKYHTTVQTIFGYLRGLPPIENASESDCLELENARQQARERCIDSACINAALVDQQREVWGLDYMPPANIHCITVSMYTLLENLDDEESCDAFVTLSIAAEAASHRWALGKGMLRLVQLTAKQMKVLLPPETEALFSDFEAKLWRHQDRKALSSQYPHFTHSMKRGEVDEIDMDTFLERFDDMQVTRESSVESKQTDWTERDGTSE